MTKSQIILEDIKIYAHHGVLPEENRIGTYYLITLKCDVDLWKAAETDDLEDTISYADINEIIHTEMAIPSKLLEHVAGRILKSVAKTYPQISYLEIKLTKTAPPMKGEMKGASVVLTLENKV
ncbi:dihydroneopterin aldolase [Riemerella columbina]|uniref:dihydroneopterin aldolase n=1 Tax=Riemerella columbina TaxID=103810 RepID=UPI0003643833|nr:dihydroneopterin aldolase [Riemerella columbina]